MTVRIVEGLGISSEPVVGDQIPDGATPTLGISLSGGGHRATLYALGALLAASELSDTARFAWVSSVSGGSLANGVIHTSGGLGRSSCVDLSATVRDRLDRLGKWHAPFNSLRSAAVAGAWLVSELGLLAGACYSLITGLHRWTVGVPIALVALVLFRLRGRVVELILADLWLREGGQKLPTLGWSTRSEDDLESDDGPAIPIFCSTDLATLSPTFIGESFIVTDRRFWTLRTTPMIRAIRASASFPGFLPAAWTRLRRLADLTPVEVDLRRSGGDLQGVERVQPRRYALLADGGVYNNIGTHWADDGRLADHDGLALPTRLRQQVDQHLVVDAGASPRGLPALLLAAPLVGIALRAWRVTLASYTAALGEQRNRALMSTWTNGAQRLTSARTIGIGQRPGWGRWQRPDGMELTHNAWRLIAWTTEGCRTHLWRIDARRSVRMVAHGYAQAVEALSEMGVPTAGRGTIWQDWLKAAVTGSLPTDVSRDAPIGRDEWRKWPRARR